MSKATPENLSLLIRARYPLLYVKTWEERRLRHILCQAARENQRGVIEWTITHGLRVMQAAEVAGGGAIKDPLIAMQNLAEAEGRTVFLMKDLHRFFGARSSYRQREEVMRALRDAYEPFKRDHKTLVVTAPVLDLPTELQKDFYVLELPPPAPDELMLTLRCVASEVRRPGNEKLSVKLSKRDAERLVNAVLGMTLEETERVFTKALLTENRLDATDIVAVRDEKEQIVEKSGLLEHCHVDDSLESVGGLEELKAWLAKRHRSFEAKARAFGLPLPRGVLLLGVQGCGKSLCAKAIAAAWGFPLLRLDIGRIFSRWFGESENNLRTALATAEAIAPVVLWIDEVEKGFSGVGRSDSDGGTASRVFGSFLTWIQEHRSGVFVVATANAIDLLPPELLRKGRFDEIFFVDLPRPDERKQIFQIHLTRRKRDPAKFDLDALVEASAGFSGAEIEQAVVSALYNAFERDNDIGTDDVLAALKETVPLSVTRRESILQLREWARHRARPASGAES